MMDAVSHGNFMIASNEVALIGDDAIKSRILAIRGVQVLLDRDLAMLYGVETKVLNQAVKRNIVRFPDGFMFQLNREEMENWKSQLVISNSADGISVLPNAKLRESTVRMGLRKRPFVFTEHGVTMLSSVLRSETAVRVSIKIIDAFVAMRRTLASMRPVLARIETIERSGTRDMVTKSRAWGNEAPVWEIEDGDDFRVVLKRPDIGGVRAASATTGNTTSKTSRYTSSKTSRYTGRIAPLRSDLEAACEGLTGNARKIMQVLSEDPGITIESLATLVKLTPYGIRYHLAGLAKSVGLHHSSDRKGGVWEVSGPVKIIRESTPEISSKTAFKTALKISPKAAPKSKRAANAEKVLSIVRDNPGVTAQQIAELIGVSQRTVRVYIKDLRSAGLRYEGPAKTGQWVISPVVTKNGGAK